MNLPLRGVAVYNPSLLSKDELLAQFVARKALLETILSELRKQERPDHRILIGPRGMGKTTLLRRIYFAVEEEPALSRRWIALPFPEEQYNLTRLSDFYLNCVDALGDALMHLGRHAEAEALDRRRDSLPDAEEEERAEAACKLLLSMADKLDRKLLLLVDNVEMVLDRLTASQWKLRELLGHDPRLCLIGASAFAPESTYNYKSAFYEFFRFHELRPLQEDEAREVLLHLARVRRAPDIERVVNEEPARVRTLFALAGGNPRTLVQLYAVLAQSTEGDARSDLERLLDECTPIYKARFEALSIQAQQIVDAAALHWHPATAADLAAATRLDVNVISSQISRLLKDGVLEAVQAAEGSRKAYQVTERFFNIWYLMRASRRQRQRLVWLVEFLRLLYGQDELPAHARKRLGNVVSGEPGAVTREAEQRPAALQRLALVRCRRGLVDDETERVARELVNVAPSAPNKLLLATILTRRGLWDEPVQLTRECLSSATDEMPGPNWDRTLDFFATVIRSKGAASALQLLEDLGFVDRWLPLHAALTAARDGKRALLGFAPEVRRPAEALLPRLEKPLGTPGAQPSVAADAPSPKPAKERRSTRPTSHPAPRSAAAAATAAPSRPARPAKTARKPRRAPSGA